MFGYAVANTDKLSPEDREKYRGVYCGICRRMGDGRKKACRLALTYDLALLAMVLSDVSGTSFTENTIRCGAHPLKQRTALTNEYTDYAADMNILLAFYKFLDDLNDDGGFLPAAEAAIFWDEAQALKEKYPALSEITERCLSGISAAEKRDLLDPEIPAGYFGDLLGSIFSYHDLPQKPLLYGFGYSLGKAIYFMDADTDLRADLKKGRYNPLVRKSAGERQALLELQLGDCLGKYRQLPMCGCKEIGNNILLSGIWTNYEAKNKKTQQAGKEAEK